MIDAHLTMNLQDSQSKIIKENVDSECIAKYNFSTVKMFNWWSKSGCGGERHPKSLKELESELTHILDFNYNCTYFEFYECEFTKSAKEKMQEIILNFLATNFSITEFKSDNDIFDKTCQDKINKFISRNRHLKSELNNCNKKQELILLCVLLGIAAGTFFFPILNTIFAMSLIFSPFVYRFLIAPLWITIERGSDEKFNCAVMSVTLVAFYFLDIWAAGLSLLSAMGGIAIQYFRESFIKSSIKKYAAPNKTLNADEIQSMKNGIDAQKGFTPLYWGFSTWKCPRAYYVGLYNSEDILSENKKYLRHSLFI